MVSKKEACCACVIVEDITEQKCSAQVLKFHSGPLIGECQKDPAIVVPCRRPNLISLPVTPVGPRLS
ncbi:hypothetical protein ACOMHN_043975 [Nucella lapillus]